MNDIEGLRRCPIRFLDLCYYEGEKVKKYKQTVEFLKFVEGNERSIIILPRGAGKSFAMALYALWKFYCLPNSRTAIFSRSHRQSKAVLETCYDIIKESPVLSMSEQYFTVRQKHRIRSHIGSEITAFPYDARTILGSHPDVILADECAFYSDDQFFRKVILPMASGVRTIKKIPKIVLASTYNRKEGFFYEISQDPEKYGYKMMKLNWRGCEGYDERKMEEKRREIGEIAFASQYECVPTDEKIAFFDIKEIEQAVSEREYAGGICYGGIDLGKKLHYASVTIMEQQKDKWVVVENINVKMKYDELCEVVQNLEDNYNVCAFLVDATGNDAFIDFARGKGISVKPFIFTKTTKIQILEYLRFMIGNGRIGISKKCEDLISDLKRYDMDQHLPDTIASLAMAVWNCRVEGKKIVAKVYAVAND